MQKKSPLYMLLKEDTVWSMDQLNHYINNKFRKTKGLPKDWVFTTFTVSAPTPRGMWGAVLAGPGSLHVLGVGGSVCTEECMSTG